MSMLKLKENKPSLKSRFFAFFDKDFYQKVERAKAFKQMMEESTKGSLNHFYNTDGEQIRGFSNVSIRTKRVEHPLIERYR